MRFQGMPLVVAIAMVCGSILGGVCGGALVASSVATVGAQGPQVVTTTQVNLVDADGQLRAILAGRDERRMASLSFYDAAGQVRSLIGIDENGTPLVRLLDPAGQSRVSAVVQDGDALVIVGDEASRSGVFGAVGDSPLLSLFDAGRSRTRLQLAESGSPSLRMFDADGRQSLAMTVDASEAPLMTFHEEGQLRAAFGVREQAAVLNLTDARQVRLVIGVAQDGRPSISFLGEDGQLVQELPLELPR